MPVGRPPKRPNDGGMDSAMGSPSTSSSSKSKLPRLDRGPEDFSAAVKSKLQSYTRTGQACDRCKVRKIRCDALPEGCSHCAQQNLECYVTDRVTGRTERRGYLQQLEREKNSMMTHIRDLEKLLADRGVHVRPWQLSNAATPYDLDAAADGNDADPSSSKDPWTQFGSLLIKDYGLDGGAGHGDLLSSSTSDLGPSMTTTSTSTTTWATGGESRPHGAHLGVAQDSAPSSSINGTQLSILGTTIDITAFDAPDMDGPPPGTSASAPPLYNKSLQSFYGSVSRVNPPVEAPLPSREDAFSYSEWYFALIGPFIPVLHKPTYFKLLGRLYDDRSFKPTTAELVVVHMVFAIMYYQWGVRNGEDADNKQRLNDLSNRHYHWCVDKVWELAQDPSLSSIQALVLLSTHCRGFPKPGPAWLISTLAWNRAIELNLHRGQQHNGGKNKGATTTTTTLDNEMRKRTWWSLFMIIVMLYGRLGKPMPIRASDIDVDMPVVVPDECLTDEGITDPGRVGDCYYLVAVAGIKLALLYMDMWDTVYSARRDPAAYAPNVRRLEARFAAYQRNLPDALHPDRCAPGGRVLASCLQASHCEFLLCLRHPSRCLIAASDPAFAADCYRVCEDAARRMLRSAAELSRLRSLDTTWYQLAIYVGAVFTLLASHWERRADVTPAELASLRDYMNTGLSVTSEILKYIGAADSRVLDQIRSIIDRTVGSIEQDMGSSQRGNSIGNNNNTSTPQQYPNRQIKHEDYGPPPSRGSRLPRSATGTPTPITNEQHQIQQQQSVHRTAAVAPGLPVAAAATPNPAAAAAASYYNSPITQINTAYSQMGYPELGGSAGPTPTTTAGGAGQTNYIPVVSEDHQHQHHPHHQQQHHHQYIYASSAAATAAAAAAAAQISGGGGGGGGGSGTSSPQSATAPHGVVGGYGSQQPSAHHTHHHQHPPGPAHHPHHHGGGGAQWMGVPNGNPWNEWTNAMVEQSSQDRYGAGTLLTLGGAGGGSGGGGGGGAGASASGSGGAANQVQRDPGAGASELGSGVGVPQHHPGQWPMLIFNPNVSGA